METKPSPAYNKDYDLRTTLTWLSKQGIPYTPHPMEVIVQQSYEQSNPLGFRRTLKRWMRALVRLEGTKPEAKNERA